MLAAEITRVGLEPFIERAKNPQKLSRDETRDLLISCLVAVSLLEDFWKVIKVRLDRGVEARELRSLVNDMLAWFDPCRAAFDRIRTQSKTVGLGVDELQILDDCAEKLGRMQRTMTDFEAWLKAPRKVVKRTDLPPAAAEKDAPGYVGLDDFAARMRAKRKA